MQLSSKLGEWVKNSDKFYIKSHVGSQKTLSFLKVILYLISGAEALITILEKQNLFLDK